jgi:branched-subunit amino acid aminotransferase/4-amino-4-deoxychorismate lyase
MGRKLLIEGQIKFLDCVNIRPDSPALNFGMGFFETVLYEKGGLFFLHEHIERMRASCRSLQIPEPNINFFKESLILSLTEENKLFDGPARIKLMYAPLFVTGEWIHIVFAESYIRPVHPAKVLTDPYIRDNVFHRHKTLSYMQNILPRISNAAFDETFFVNHNGHITEGTASNILCVKHGVLHYAGCETNCLSGIMMNRIVNDHKDIGFGSCVPVKGGILMDFVRGCEEVIISNSLIIARNVCEIRYRNEDIIFSNTSSSGIIRKFYLK